MHRSFVEHHARARESAVRRRWHSSEQRRQVVADGRRNAGRARRFARPADRPCTSRRGRADRVLSARASRGLHARARVCTGCRGVRALPADHQPGWPGRPSPGRRSHLSSDWRGVDGAGDPMAVQGVGEPSTGRW